jgi:hypothetical protein
MERKSDGLQKKYFSFVLSVRSVNWKRVFEDDDGSFWETLRDINETYFRSRKSNPNDAFRHLGARGVRLRGLEKKKIDSRP